MLATLWGYPFEGCRNSISGTYWTNARLIFVLLFGIAGIFMILYKGYNWQDRVVNILAGISLLALVIFPTFSDAVMATDPRVDYNLFPDLNKRVSTWIHIVFSGIGLACFFINCIFLFTKHSGEITDKKKVRNIIYQVCGYVILVMYLFSTVLVLKSTSGNPSKIFPLWTCMICEILEIGAVGFAWLVKGESLRFFNDDQQ